MKVDERKVMVVILQVSHNKCWSCVVGVSGHYNAGDMLLQTPYKTLDSPLVSVIFPCHYI